jgi:hypothetical protein
MTPRLPSRPSRTPINLEIILIRYLAATIILVLTAGGHRTQRERENRYRVDQ